MIKDKYILEQLLHHRQMIGVIAEHMIFEGQNDYVSYMVNAARDFLIKFPITIEGRAYDALEARKFLKENEIDE